MWRQRRHNNVEGGLRRMAKTAGREDVAAATIQQQGRAAARTRRRRRGRRERRGWAAATSGDEDGQESGAASTRINVTPPMARKMLNESRLVRCRMRHGGGGPGAWMDFKKFTRQAARSWPGCEAPTCRKPAWHRAGCFRIWRSQHRPTPAIQRARCPNSAPDPSPVACGAGGRMVAPPDPYSLLSSACVHMQASRRMQMRATGKPQLQADIRARACP